MNWKILSSVVVGVAGLTGLLYLLSHQDTREHDGPAVNDQFRHALVIEDATLDVCAGDSCPIADFGTNVSYRVDTTLPSSNFTDKTIRLLGQVCEKDTWRTPKQNCDAKFPVAVGSHTGTIQLKPRQISGKQGALIELELRAGEDNPMRTQPAMDMVAQTTSASPTWK